MQNLNLLINELVKLPTETEWLEFKHDNYDPDTIGKDISALANGATYREKSCAYMIWGVDDKTHEVVGTGYDLQTLKIGNEEIGNWLRNMLSSNANFEYHMVRMNDKNIGVLIIYKATGQTVMFKKVDYIRIGSYTKALNEYPAVKTQLWDRLRNIRFESQYAKQDLELRDAIKLLDYYSYFDILDIPQPSDITGIEHYLIEEGVIAKLDNGLFAVTNLGALLFAKRLADFPSISRKAIRVVQFNGNNRLEMLKEYTGEKGYVVDFEGIIKYIEALTPSREIIDGAFREKQTAYPIIAIREAVANALIHQDFSITGTGPVVEVFANRIEITNSGTPLVDIKRIIDNPPKSRNEKLAELMRRLRICEELGTGWDKIAISCELCQLPAPKIELYEDSTRVVLYSEMPFSSLSPEDKLWACYLHSCIKYVQGEQLTNSSLRKRFGLNDSSSGSVSRLIKDAVSLKFIRPLDDHTAPRYMKYIPNWA